MGPPERLPRPPATAGSPAGFEHPLSYLARHRAWVALGALFLLGTNLVAQAIPWAVKWTVDAIAQASSGWQVAQHALAVAGLAVVQAATRVPSRIFIFNAAREAEYELRGALFERLCLGDRAFFHTFRVGDLMSRLTNDIASVRALFGPGVLHVVNTVFAYAVALPLMIGIDPWLTLWALLPYPLLLLGARYFARGIYHRSQQMQRALATMNSAVQEDLAGIRELRLYGIEETRAQQFAHSSRDYLAQAVRLAGWRAGLIPFVGLGAGASLVIVLWVGGAGVIAGELTLGDLVAFNLYVGMLAWPTMSIGWIMSLWQRGIASWHRLQELARARPNLAVDLARAAAPRQLPPGEPAPDGRGVTVRGLSLSLGQTRVLRRVDLDVADGSICAVVGRVGSGKSTLVDAVARLIEVPAGTIFIGGRDVTELPVGWVRAQIAYAPQTAFLFSASIRANVALGVDDPDDGGAREARRVERAVEAAGLSPDLERFPDGLDTVVGERGVSLSGGQRQRIALARALASSRPILILDDTLSAVDADTEREILERLRGMVEERTVLLISHRLSALQHADQIVVLEQGRVAEAGSHDELLRRGGPFAELYRRQLLSDELAGLDGRGP